LNFARIIAIYLAHEGVGSWDVDAKREGMLNGIGNPTGSKKGIHQKVRPANSRRVVKNWVVKWQSVFANDPYAVLNSELIDCLETYLCNRETTDDHALLACLEEHDGWESELGKVKSKMTVAEWVSSPWHLEHLPYQRQHAVFRDGECYSEGCKRCSRTFYEYAYHVYADRTAKVGTFGYPQDLWFRDDMRWAPAPLHDPVFWTDNGRWDTAVPGDPGAGRYGRAEGGSDLSRPNKKQPPHKKPVPKATPFEYEYAEVDRDGRVPREFEFYTGGNMAWPTFLLDPKRLHSTDTQRTHVKGAPMWFRRYINLAYSDGQTNGVLEDKDQTYYKSVNQGYMLSGRHKVAFGDECYKVTRSHKYGNVCRDCASLLDRAPGLFVRNNRWQFAGGIVAGNSSAVSQSATDFWMLLFGKLGLNDSDTSMDAFLMQSRPDRLSRLPAAERAAWINNFEQSAEQLAKGLNERHRFPNGWTRLVAQPTIHVQTSISHKEAPSTGGHDYTVEKTQEAIKTLNALLNGADPRTLDLNNTKLRDIVKDAERNLLHNEAFARTDHTKQFDSDVKRTEYRNCIVVWSREGLRWLNPPGSQPLLRYNAQDARLRGGVLLPELSSHGHMGAAFGELTKGRYIAHYPNQPVVYYNCLITNQFDPDVLDDRANTLLPYKRTPAYRVEVYLSTRVGPTGSARQSKHAPSQWSGDGFVCAKPSGTDEIWKLNPSQDDGRVWKQVRTMRQSRVFITYSLHRAITSEGQGRAILERMADALYTLFGIDKWLSEMIVFGKMLKSMDVANQKQDNVSSNIWGVIGKTNKDDAMAGFYGSRDKTRPRTSYIYDTYETHVDKVEVDAGCEIGPKMGHPHFHLLLTITHFSYVQFDYFKMNTFLEIMFRGIDTFHGWGPTPEKPLGPFYLGAAEDPFYGDNENPYVDIKLYPQDNWKEILAAYVRKNVVPSVIEVQTAGRLPGTAQWRRNIAAGIPGGVGPMPNPN
jgi:hypothetical protein